MTPTQETVQQPPQYDEHALVATANQIYFDVTDVAPGNVPTHPLDTVPGPYSPGDELAHKISRIAVAHQMAGPEYGHMLRVAGGEFSSAEADDQLVQRGGDRTIPPFAEQGDDAQAKAAVLATISHEVSLHALRNIVPGADRSEAHIDWHGATQNMVVEADAAEDIETRKRLLLSGTIAAQLAEDDTVRIDFLSAVYDHSLEAVAAEACNASPLTILQDAPSAVWGYAGGTSETHQLYAVHKLAPAFTIEPERAADYLALLARKNAEKQAAAQDAADQPASTSSDLPSAKKLQKQLMAQEHTADEESLASAQAREVSVDGEKVAGGLYDQYKIERFALQAMFIKDQAKALFGATTAELINSPYAQVLESKRGQDTILDASEVPAELEGVSYCEELLYNPYTHDKKDPRAEAEKRLIDDTNQLQADITETFTQLSEPIVARYTHDESQPPATREQGAAARFKTVMQRMQEHTTLSKFVNIKTYLGRSQNEIVDEFGPGVSIYATSQDGAAVPAVVNGAVSGVMRIAAEYQHTTGDKPTPDELLEILQTNRVELLGVASHNIAEFMAGGENDPNLRLQRNDGGTLQIGHTDEHGVFHPRMRTDTPPKGSLDEYAAITLGCPALHEIHAARTELKRDDIQRLVYGSANFIDHTLAASFNEAHARGILDVTRYAAIALPPPEAATQPQPVDVY